jgi:hypothetical protein
MIIPNFLGVLRLIMKCTICGTSVESAEDADKGEWIFCFYDGEDEHGPSCPSCSDLLLSTAKDGEYELKNEYRGKIIYDDNLEHEEEDPLEQVVLGFILN